MKYQQLEFKEIELINNNMYICNTCNKCVHDCKVYSISKDTILYCRKYKHINNIK